MSAVTISGEKFRYETDNEHFCGNSSLRGTIVTDYFTLVEKFGEPMRYTKEDSDGKVTVEWTIEFMNEETYELKYATIYDWKTGETPYGQYDWHIGGYSHEAVELVTAIVKGA